jgi:predicted nucleic acid-binding protein
MVTFLTLDSSILVAALYEKEERHSDCKRLLKKIIDAKIRAFEPYTVLVEVVAAIRRRTGSKELAQKVGKSLGKIDTINFLELEKRRTNEAWLGRLRSRRDSKERML